MVMVHLEKGGSGLEQQETLHMWWTHRSHKNDFQLEKVLLIVICSGADADAI